ncbi:MAG: hypothetical protein AAFZ63_24980 [Bacteroidota bacterium]
MGERNAGQHPLATSNDFGATHCRYGCRANWCGDRNWGSESYYNAAILKEASTEVAGLSPSLATALDEGGEEYKQEGEGSAKYVVPAVLAASKRKKATTTGTIIMS